MEPLRHVRTWMAVAGLAAVALFSSPAGAQRSGKGYFVYFGTYTRNVGKGIYAYRFDPATGRLTSMGLAAETPSPAFLVVHPNGRFLYAANEHDGEDTPGKNNTVSAFAIDPDVCRMKVPWRVSGLFQLFADPLCRQCPFPCRFNLRLRFNGNTAA